MPYGYSVEFWRSMDGDLQQRIIDNYERWAENNNNPNPIGYTLPDRFDDSGALDGMNGNVTNPDPPNVVPDATQTTNPYVANDDELPDVDPVERAYKSYEASTALMFGALALVFLFGAKAK